MNDIQIFNSPEFGKIRTVLNNDEPMFCLTDVCKALGIAQPSKVKERLNEKGVHSIPTLTTGGEQNLLYINEANLYKTIFQSRKESAEHFTDWVTGEVLPSIRKTGSYTIPQTTDGKIALLAQGHMELKAEVDEIKTDLEMLKMDLPLLPIEADKITEAVRRKGVYLLGGKQSEAYSNRSLRQKVYNNIYSNLKYQFGVKSYKSIKRSQCDTAIQLVDEYKLPYFLSEQINQMNRQMNML